jgi:hypothetical protein
VSTYSPTSASKSAKVEKQKIQKKSEKEIEKKRKKGRRKRRASMRNHDGGKRSRDKGQSTVSIIFLLYIPKQDKDNPL